MRTASETLKSARRDEIVAACAALYETHGFKDITIGAISDATSFSRPSIYNYFETKEEIFLELFAREHERWIAELEQIAAEPPLAGTEAFADRLAQSLAHRPLLLKLLSMNCYDMEENSRLERVTAFKQVYGRALHCVGNLARRTFPTWTDAQTRGFVYGFFPFMFGIYPYTVATDKQRAAIEAAQTGFVLHSIYELSYNGILRLAQQPGTSPALEADSTPHRKRSMSMAQQLVAYFSASAGTTAKVARKLASATGADLYEIAPAQPYTAADLNWNDSGSRTSIESRDEGARPALAQPVPDLSGYDTVFVGFPIWWYREPRIVDTFLEGGDFAGKTVVPFATSGGSQIGNSGALMQQIVPAATVKAGKRFAGSVSVDELRTWAAQQ